MEAQARLRWRWSSPREHLLSLQDEAGWWRGELQTNVTMDAEDMLLREFLGDPHAQDETERSAAWIRSQQRADGTWANFYGGPGELSTTIEAYWALRLAGDDPGEPSTCASPREFIREQGGLEQARVFTHLWLALFGLWSWERVPALPPEIVLLPSWVPLNVYDFACWARQTIVALSLVKAHRPVRVRCRSTWTSCSSGAPQPAARERARAPRRGARLAGARSTALLRAYERRPLAPLRRLALARAERWIVRRQEADGSWGGIQPPWVYSLIALRPVRLSARPPGDEARARGDRALHGRGSRRLARRRRAGGTRAGAWKRASRRCGTRRWRCRAQRRRPGRRSSGAGARRRVAARRGGDGAAATGRSRGPGSRPAAGRSSSPTSTTPTSTTPPRSCSRCSGSRASGRCERQLGDAGAIERAAALGGGHAELATAAGARSTPRTRARSCASCPFLDFGEVIDEPSADVTAHTVEMLAALGLADERARRAAACAG